MSAPSILLSMRKQQILKEGNATTTMAEKGTWWYVYPRVAFTHILAIPIVPDYLMWRPNSGPHPSAQPASFFHPFCLLVCVAFR